MRDDSLTEKAIEELGYQLPIPLGDGRWLAFQPMAGGQGAIYLIQDRHSWSSYWSYPDCGSAIVALLGWETKSAAAGDDPPGLWLKQKMSQRLGPGWLDNPLWMSRGPVFVAQRGSGRRVEKQIGTYANAIDAAREAVALENAIVETEAVDRLDKEPNRSEMFSVRAPDQTPSFIEDKPRTVPGAWVEIERRDPPEAS
jgi:hypothetical protein